MSKHALFLAVLFAVLPGCGDGTDSSTTAPATTRSAPTPMTTAASLVSVTVFRVRNGRLVAQVERVPSTRAIAAASLAALGLASPVSIAGGTATVERDEATPQEVAEIVYTLTQYPRVQRVDVAGQTGLTRADAAAFVPPILIERPADGATTATSISVAGSASVYEANVVLELRRDGKLVQKQVVTAAEGAPGRGPFSGMLVAPDAGRYLVAAYSPSAVDGSPQHEQDVSVTVTP